MKAGWLVGPVFSRRLGRSLGVDLLKGECTFLCPYCEVRVHHVGKLELFPFRRAADLYAEYEAFCKSHGRRDVDSVTFSGTGEPTLISNLGEILRRFREIGPYPLTVITNGSMLWNPQVRENLKPADLVVPSLDAVAESAWRRVNRPHPDLTLDRYLDGTKRFCAGHPGRIWMEVLLVRGVNDASADLDALGTFLRLLKLERVQVGTVDRPPSRSRARPLARADLLAAVRRLRRLSGHVVEVMSRQTPRRPRAHRPVSVSGLSETIFRSVRLRPQTLEELKRLLPAPSPAVTRAVRGLEASGRIHRHRQGRRIFLQASPEPA